MLSPFASAARPAFDDLVMVAAALCNAPMAFVATIADDELWIVSRTGLAIDRARRGRGLFEVIRDGVSFELSDSACDVRFEDANEIADLHFATGRPLRTADGELWGGLCVLDRVSRTLSGDQRRSLDALARQLERALPGRRGRDGSARPEPESARPGSARPASARPDARLESAPPEDDVANDRRLRASDALDRMWMLDDAPLEQLLTTALRITIAHVGVACAALDFQSHSGKPVSITVTDASARESASMRVVYSEHLPLRAQGTLRMLDGARARPRGMLEAADRWFVRLAARYVAMTIARQDRELERADSLDRLQKIAAHVPGMIYQYHLSVDGSSRYPYVSEGIRDIFRVGPEAVRDDASPVFAVLHPEDRDSVYASIRLSAERLTPWYDRYRIRFDDGTVRWLDAHATPTRLDDGSTLWHGFISDVTDRIQQARALEAEREMNRRLLEALPVGVIACDDDGRLSLFNHVARRWHGVDSVSNEPDAWDAHYEVFETDCVTPIVPERTPLARALRGERVRDAEVSIVVNGQAARQVTTNGVLLRSKDGTPMGAVAVMLDITERKRAEEELRKTAATLRHVLDAALEAAIIATDLEGRITMFNAGAERMLGYTGAEVLGRSHLGFEPLGLRRTPWGEDPPQFGPAVAGFGVFVGMAQRAGTEMRECTFVTRTRELVPVSVYASTIRDEQGTALGYLGLAVDNSERLRNEAALREHARNTQAILDNVVDAIVTIDARGHIESFNPAAERVFGVNAAQMSGRSVRLLLPAESRVGALARLLAVRDQAVEFEGARADGSRFEMEIAISNLEREGRPLFIGIVRDVSERRRIERMKNEFTSTVSHELRTPLTSIAGSLGLLDGGALGELPEHAMRMIRIAYKNCQRLTDLINDLLDMDKILAGKMRLDMRNHPVMPLVTQALAANEGYGLRHEVHFAVVERADDAEICVDANRLLQILANFLSNAAKFSPPGAQVEVMVSADDTHVRIGVRDHGPGVPPAFHDKIFERFSQADSSDTRQRGGTGLGLAITRSLAEHMDARVGFDSVEGQGATFYIDLRRVNVHGEDSIPNDMSRFSSQSPDDDELPLVLHIEANADVRAVLRFQCATVAKFESASSLRDARARLSGDGPLPDLMLLDVELPDGSGIVFAREIHARFPELPIVVLSAAELDAGEVEWASAVHVKSRTTTPALLATLRACHAKR